MPQRGDGRDPHQARAARTPARDARAFPAERRAQDGLTRNSPGLAGELAYWSATQKIQAVHDGDKKFMAKDVLPFLATALKDSNEVWRLLIAIRDDGGFHAGHAVIPFGYFRGEREGQYFIRIYDSNFPGAERRIELDTKANTWTYSGSPNPDFPRVYVGDATNGNFLYFSPVTRRMGVLTPPFSEGFAASSTSGTMLVEGEGTTVGFKDGALIENGGTLFPGASDCFCKAPSGITNVQLKGSGTQTVKVAADAGTVYATSPSVSVKVEGGVGTDGLTVNPTTKAVTFNTDGDSATTITTTTKNADGSQTTVRVTVDQGTKGITVDASDPNNVKVSADVTMNNTTIRVTTTVTEPDGTSTTTEAQGRTSGGNDVAISVNTSTQTTTVNTSINLATCKNGVKDPLEADVDCGSFCATQVADDRFGDGLCAEQKSCSALTDCRERAPGIPSECFNSKCTFPSCTDGRKNGNETSVDCGRGCACGNGAPCMSDYDCDRSVTPSVTPYPLCLNNVCRASVYHELTVLGVPPNGGYFTSLISDGIDLGYTDWLVRGRPGGGPATMRFPAATSFKLKWFLGDPLVTCTFDNAASDGSWTWTNTNLGSPPVAQTKTARCHRSVVTFAYNVSGGCRWDTDVTPPGSPLEVRETFSAGPTISLVSNNPGIVAAPMTPPFGLYGDKVIGLNVPAGWEFGTLRYADGGVSYDGGTAYSVVIGPPGVGFSTYLYRAPGGPTAAQITNLDMPLRKYSMDCAVAGPSSGAFPDFDLKVPINCSCTELDSGWQPRDAGSPDAGFDAGTFDAGFDAGTPDAGFDAGTPLDAGMGPVCTRDTDCTSQDCQCGANSGNCAGNVGRCGAGKVIITAPTTNGIASSGAFTVPASCGTVFVEAWGAAGGGGKTTMPFPMTQAGGAGGFVQGTLQVTAGDVITAWIAQGGDEAGNLTAMGTPGIGSFYGVATNGGTGDNPGSGDQGGSGGGLTSVRLTRGGTPLISFTVAGGGGGGSISPGSAAGATGLGTSGDNTVRAGGNAAAGSLGGGGGAGENGGLGAPNMGQPSSGGGFGTLTSSLTARVGNTGAPAGGTNPDYAACTNSPGTNNFGGAGGNGCLVLRCVAP